MEYRVNGVLMSDFVRPGWFDPMFVGQVDAPWAITYPSQKVDFAIKPMVTTKTAKRPGKVPYQRPFLSEPGGHQ